MTFPNSIFADKCFIAVYTCEAKAYCDEEFSTMLLAYSAQGAEVHIVDNSQDQGQYAERLRELCPFATVKHIHVPPGPHYFLRAVTSSVNILRDDFLQSSKSYFLIIESDVMPPVLLFDAFEPVANQADIIGGLYYTGYHKDELWKMETQTLIPVTSEKEAVLSGCTLYSRPLLEHITFRYESHTPAAFPDAWMTMDALATGHKACHFTGIKCRHAAKENGDRGFSYTKEFDK